MERNPVKDVKSGYSIAVYLQKRFKNPAVFLHKSRSTCAFATFGDAALGNLNTR